VPTQALVWVVTRLASTVTLLGWVSLKRRNYNSSNILTNSLTPWVAITQPDKPATGAVYEMCGGIT